MSALITLAVPYYNQPRMLAHHLREWGKYPGHIASAFRFVIVDDGSQTHPASEVVHAHLMADADVCLPALYRIVPDIPWNRGGARNLVAQQSVTPWLLMLDIDHVLTAENAERLVAHLPLRNTTVWYRFPRERIGRADETRRKDDLADDVERGPVKPHIDSYLVGRSAYWAAGGYNEAFSGCLGGGTVFLAELTATLGEPALLDDVVLQVHTRHSVPDANTPGLSRDLAEFTRRRHALSAEGKLRGHEPYCRFEWRRVL